jgi:hypothetical protein
MDVEVGRDSDSFDAFDEAAKLLAEMEQELY